MGVAADLSYVETRSQQELDEANKLVEAEIQVLLQDDDYMPDMPPLNESLLVHSTEGVIPQFKFPKSGNLAKAYEDRARNNLELLEEMGPTHLSVVNQALESSLTIAEGWLAKVKAEVNELNLDRRRTHQEAIDTINNLEDTWRSKVRSIVDEYVDKTLD